MHLKEALLEIGAGSQFDDGKLLRGFISIENGELLEKRTDLVAYVLVKGPILLLRLWHETVVPLLHPLSMRFVEFHVLVSQVFPNIDSKRLSE